MEPSDAASDRNPTQAASLSSLAECASCSIQTATVPLSAAQKQLRECLADFKRDVAEGRINERFKLKQWVANRHSETFPIPSDFLHSPLSWYTSADSSIYMETTPWFVASQNKKTRVVLARYRIAYVILEDRGLGVSPQLAGHVRLGDLSGSSVLPGVGLPTCWIMRDNGKRCSVREENCCYRCMDKTVRDVIRDAYPSSTRFIYRDLDTDHVVYMEKQTQVANGPVQARAVRGAESWKELLESE